jgi:hypothetical protein
MIWRPLKLPLIDALDLTYPDKFFRPMEFDPEDEYRCAMRIERRRQKVGLPPRSHREILHHAATMQLRIGTANDDRVWVMR